MTALLALFFGLVPPDVPPASAETGCSSGLVALTFDDGPDTHTASVLQVLGDLRVGATFFVEGAKVDQDPAGVQRMKDGGHLVANHSYSHRDLTDLNDDEVEAEILDTDMAIRAAGVEPLELLRPPFGHYDQRIESIASDVGYALITWNVNPEDYESTADEIESHVLTNLFDGAVVLLHDGSTNTPETVEALPGIVDGVRERDYCLAQLDEHGELVRPEATHPSASDVVSGDWNGDGRVTAGRFDDGVWTLSDEPDGSDPYTLTYGRAGDVPVTGDWIADGRGTIGVVRADQWVLRYEYKRGADLVYTF